MRARWGRFNGRALGYEGEDFIAYFWFVGWDCLSLGFHVCLGAPNVELHVPFGFVRIGRKTRPARGLMLEVRVVTPEIS